MTRPTSTSSEVPRCDKCGAEITTGLMAAFCEKGKDCEFYVPALDDFMAEFGLRRNYDQPQ